MSAPDRPKSLSPWARWYRRALPAYWMFLFCVTHFPQLALGDAIPASDKTAHLVAFALLAFLFWRFAETFRHPLPHGFVWMAALCLLLYAGVDEYLQRFVGRYASLHDFLFNAIGVLVVLALLEWRRRYVATRSA